MKRLLPVVLVVLGLGLAAQAQTAGGNSAADVGAITKLRFVTIVVKDYEEALKWYTEILGFEKIQDRKFGAGHRWIVVAPKEQQEIGLVLAVSRPLTPEDKTINYMDRLGKETNWVFQSPNVRKLYERLSSRGVKFIERPTAQPWGTIQAVFEDLYGNVFVVEGPNQKSERLTKD